MARIEDLRELALQLPETEEGSHFRQKAFRARKKAFIGIEKGDTHATFALKSADVEALVARNPALYEAIRRNGKQWIGVRIELGKISRTELEGLVKTSWDAAQ
jgi:predicted DNA-binding protein (MmcQ/YjbR family)